MPTQAELVRGAISLALFCTSAAEKPHLIEMLAMLENQALGRLVEFDQNAKTGQRHWHPLCGERSACTSARPPGLRVHAER